MNRLPSPANIAAGLLLALLPSLPGCPTRGTSGDDDGFRTNLEPSTLNVENPTMIDFAEVMVWNVYAEELHPLCAAGVEPFDECAGVVETPAVYIAYAFTETGGLENQDNCYVPTDEAVEYIDEGEHYDVVLDGNELVCLADDE